jgi:hypothetical protein
MSDPSEPYIQQMSFMFVAMPSALAIIHHYYHNPTTALPQQHLNEEEKQDNSPDTEPAATPTHKRVLSQTGKALWTNVADTSQKQQQRNLRPPTDRTRNHLSGYDDDKFSQTDGTDEPLFGEFK